MAIVYLQHLASKNTRNYFLGQTTTHPQNTLREGDGLSENTHFPTSVCLLCVQLQLDAIRSSVAMPLGEPTHVAHANCKEGAYPSLRQVLSSFSL